MLGNMLRNKTAAARTRRKVWQGVRRASFSLYCKALDTICCGAYLLRHGFGSSTTAASSCPGAADAACARHRQYRVHTRDDGERVVVYGCFRLGPVCYGCDSFADRSDRRPSSDDKSVAHYLARTSPCLGRHRRVGDASEGAPHTDAASLPTRTQIRS